MKKKIKKILQLQEISETYQKIQWHLNVFLSNFGVKLDKDKSKIPHGAILIWSPYSFSSICIRMNPRGRRFWT